MENGLMKTTVTIALCLTLAASSTSGFLGTPYSKMTCSQFTCAYTGHCTGNASQLFREGRDGVPQDGDIVAFGGKHVAVMTDKGLMDSVPERGVGFVSVSEMKDAWYSGPIRIIKTGR